MFSAGAATLESPIRLSIPGRKLTNADRIYRTSLQKYWLSKYVPSRFEFRMRTMSKCGLEVEGEYPFCDRYSFLDQQSGKEADYYIYIGNWP